MEKKQYKKVVLAYSGGLDTSIIIAWLKDVYKRQLKWIKIVWDLLEIVYI